MIFEFRDVNQFLLNERGICTQTMPEAKSAEGPQYSWIQDFSERLSEMRALRSGSYLSLPWCWSGAGSSTSMGGTRGKQGAEKRQCPLQRSWWGEQDGEGVGGGCFILTGLETLCPPTHLLWCSLLIPKAMSKWLAEGWKRQVTIQMILHPFMAIRAAGMMRWRVAVECYKPFRRCLLRHCSSSWIT